MDTLHESGILENLPVRDDGTLDLTELARRAPSGGLWPSPARHAGCARRYFPSSESPMVMSWS